ncbi:MAG: carbon monoxide dehydrogenase [Propionibacteriales bacterium]|nr:carbon monoxide dehydrogenase [Propionibacteriales bacterium]
MKVQGSAVLHAAREDVWRALNDPAVLVRTIPGCEQLVEIGTDRYRMTVQAGVASVKGTFAGEVRLHDQQRPGSFVLTATGAGAPGTVHADVTVSLTEDGDATRLDYAADAIVGGMIGGVGQRMLSSATKKTANEFFGAVEDVLTGKAPAVAPTAGVEPSAAGVYEAPQRAVPARSGDFGRGVAVGAGIALLGALVGGWVSGRRRS